MKGKQNGKGEEVRTKNDGKKIKTRLIPKPRREAIST
jgi:hypothetical protein